MTIKLMNSFGDIYSVFVFFVFLMDQLEQACNFLNVMFSQEHIVQGVVFIALQCPAAFHWDSELTSYHLFNTYQW